LEHHHLHDSKLNRTNIINLKNDHAAKGFHFIILLIKANNAAEKGRNKNTVVNLNTRLDLLGLEDFLFVELCMFFLPQHCELKRHGQLENWKKRTQTDELFLAC
jgi:hypothetical protein